MRRLRRAIRAGEGGFLTIWMLGLCFLLLALGGVSVDLWHVFAARQQLEGIVDAAALAGASGISPPEAQQGVVRLDAAQVTRLVQASVAAQLDRSALVSCCVVDLQGTEVTVSATGHASLTLLRLLSGQAQVTFDVSSTAAVHRSP
ncbi:MAG TPA: pilus assembly protein TadG-related protein [Actinomycetota bacterium]|nr:pilus assembly protein TadG-related protein [Actinomycetota bacterium]